MHRVERLYYINLFAKIITASAKRIDSEPINLNIDISNLKLSQLLFRHTSPLELSVLKPQTYASLIASRSNDLGRQNAITYINERKENESRYHKLLNSNGQKSFIYATIVGFHMMEDPIEFPGFTYYFKLTASQLDETIFEVVSGKDKKLNRNPQVGLPGLEESIKHWLEHKNAFEPIYDNLLGGDIDPRIEVVIPYEVTPQLFIPEQEQR